MSDSCMVGLRLFAMPVGTGNMKAASMTSLSIRTRGRLMGHVDLYDLYIGNNAKRIIRYGDNGEDCILADMISNNQGTKPSPLHVADIYERYIDEMNG